MTKPKKTKKDMYNGIGCFWMLLGIGVCFLLVCLGLSLPVIVKIVIK